MSVRSWGAPDSWPVLRLRLWTCYRRVRVQWLPPRLATHIAIDPGPTTHQSGTVASNTAAAETPPTESIASASDATKTGLGAGLGVGVPLLAGLILALVLLRRLRSQDNSQRADFEKKTTGVELDGERRNLQVAYPTDQISLTHSFLSS